jgi:hypothetical protein
MRHNYFMKLVRGVLGSVAVAAASGVAYADAAPAVMTTGAMTAPEQLLVNPYTFDLGTFLVSSKVNGNLRGTASGNNNNVDFSQNFGTDASESRIRADFLWRITSKHQIRFAYFNDDVSRSRQITQTINWGDYSFGAPGLVKAETKFNIYEATYEYALIKDRDYDVLVTAGIHVDDFTAKLTGNATYTPPNGPPQVVMGATASNSVTAPLPVLGVRGDWAATEHLYLDASGQVFKFSYQGIDGNWSDIWVGATWMFNEHFGIGVAYDRFAVHVDLSKGAFNGRLNLGYQGGLIFVRGAF